MIKSMLKAFIPTYFRKHLHYQFWRTAWDKYRSDRDDLGSSAAAMLMFSTIFQKDRASSTSIPATVRQLRLRGYRRPFYYRDGTSDAAVIRQVLGHREYDCVGRESNVSFIIDCGANIGCTSFYFLNQYPNARLLAVEPDQRNYELCRRNLWPFRDRASVIHAGVWSTCESLCVERGGYRDGREWSFQVRPCRNGEAADFVSTTIPQLIARSGFPRVDILKIDIEAAEKEVFRVQAESWLRQVKNVIIELHDQECEDIFFKAMSSFTYQMGHSGDLTYCNNLAPRDLSR